LYRVNVLSHLYHEPEWTPGLIIVLSAAVEHVVNYHRV